MSEKAKHFTEVEKQVLLSLVQEKAEILESKKSDGRTVDCKKRAWEEVASNFNSCGEVNNGSSQQLKKCWENIKSWAKKDLADEKRERRLTGGGEYRDLERLMSQVLGIIPTQLQPLHNPYDEDASYHQGLEAACIEEGKLKKYLPYYLIYKVHSK